MAALGVEGLKVTQSAAAGSLGRKPLKGFEHVNLMLAPSVSLAACGAQGEAGRSGPSLVDGA